MEAEEKEEPLAKLLSHRPRETVDLFGLAVKLCHGEAVGNATVAFGMELQAFVKALLVGHYVRGGDNGKCT